MRNIEQVGSAGQKCANMASNAVLLAFTLVLGFKCWQVCDNHRCVPVAPACMGSANYWVGGKMPRLSVLDRARAIGQLETGVPAFRVAASFGVSPGTISKLRAKFRETGEVKDRPRSGRPKKTTPQEDRFLTLAALRNRRLSARHLQQRFAERSSTRY